METNLPSKAARLRTGIGEPTAARERREERRVEMFHLSGFIV
jgi:hypothetical protein